MSSKKQNPKELDQKPVETTESAKRSAKSSGKTVQKVPKKTLKKITTQELSMEASTRIRLLEATLFLENEPIELEILAERFEVTKEEIGENLLLLNQVLIDRDAGLRVDIHEQGVTQLIPAEDLWAELSPYYGTERAAKLSRAAQETLAIIAYGQPITRREIENIRGVSADNMLRLLMEKEFVQVVGRREGPGRPSLYGTTKEFLNFFNLLSISGLPKMDEINQYRFNDRYEEE